MTGLHGDNADKHNRAEPPRRFSGTALTRATLGVGAGAVAGYLTRDPALGFTVAAATVTVLHDVMPPRSR